MATLLLQAPARPPLLLATLCLLASLAAGQFTPKCYFPNAKFDEEGVACNPSASTLGTISACCKKGETCYQSGACYTDWGLTYRRSCTDPSFKDPSCPKMCTAGADQKHIWIWVQTCDIEAGKACCVMGKVCCDGPTFSFRPGPIVAVLDDHGRNRLLATATGAVSSATGSSTTATSTSSSTGSDATGDPCLPTGGGSVDQSLPRPGCSGADRSTAPGPDETSNGMSAAKWAALTYALGASLGTVLLASTVAITLVWRRKNAEQRGRRDERDAHRAEQAHMVGLLAQREVGAGAAYEAGAVDVSPLTAPATHARVEMLKDGGRNVFVSPMTVPATPTNENQHPPLSLWPHYRPGGMI